VVVIPDVRGLYDHFHDIARRLAREGFVALPLNLYSRGDLPDTSSLEATFDFMRQLPDRRVLQDLEAALRFLRTRPEVRDREVGVMGFCMGGKYATLAACSIPGFGAAVPWYGMLRSDVIDANNPEHAIDAIPRLRCPMLALFGADDPLIPQSDVRELERRVAENDLEVDVIVYPGAGHAFFNDTRPDAFRPEAAESAWVRAVEFLHRHLDL
jgi:carboxymethylenebutenolidase